MRAITGMWLALLTTACGRGDSTPSNDAPPRTEPTSRAEAGSQPEPEPSPAVNVFENPGFEQGREPWFSLAGPERPYWADFEVTTEQAHSGEHSAVLRVSSVDFPLHTRVYGALREFRGGPLPAKVSGWYRVDDWNRGADNQYVQVVVAVTKAKGLPRPQEPKQIAYVLAGLDHDPFPIRNRRFVFEGPREPKQGEWIHFEFFIRDDFERYWGAVPDEYATLRVFFEGRFDKRTKDDDVARANVYFDDLYLGNR